MSSRPPVSVQPVTRLPAASLESILLSTVGSRPAERDPNDARILDSVRARSGRIIDRRSEVGFVRPPPTRTELELPAEPHADPDGDGYTALEAWLFERAEALTRP